MADQEPTAAESPADKPAAAASAPPKAPIKPKLPGLARPAAAKPAAAAAAAPAAAPKPKAKPAAAAPKAGKGKKAAAGGEGGEAAAKGPKKPLSAYMFFSSVSTGLMGCGWCDGGLRLWVLLMTACARSIPPANRPPPTRTIPCAGQAHRSQGCVACSAHGLERAASRA